MITDEQLIDACLDSDSRRQAATKLGVSNEAVGMRLKRMQLAGVHMPPFKDTRGGPSKYSLEKVEHLNAYIQRKRQG